MAHTFDTNLRFYGSNNPLVQNYTCGSGATVLVLGIVTGGATVRAGGAPTYNGIALTQADQTRKYANQPETSCELWYLLGPPTGASYQISVPNTGPRPLFIQASSYKAQSGYTSVLDVANGDTGNSPGASKWLTTTVNGDVIVGVCGHGYDSAPLSRSGTVLNETDNGGFSDNNQYKLQSTAGAFLTYWNTLQSDDWCVCVAAFKEVAADQKVVIPALSLALSFNVPILVGPQTIEVSTLPLSLQLKSPSIIEGNSQTIIISALPLSLVLKIPLIAIGQMVVVPTLPLSLTLKAPTLVITVNQIVYVSALPLSLELKSPSIAIGSSQTIVVFTLPLSLELKTPFINVPMLEVKVRLVPFIYSAEIAYVLEFGHNPGEELGYIRFYYDGEPLLDENGNHVEIETPYAQADLWSLHIRQLADTMWITHPKYQQRKLTRTTAITFALDVILLKTGPFLTRNDLIDSDVTNAATMTPSVTAIGTFGTLTCSSPDDFFVDGHIGALFKLTHKRLNTISKGSRTSDGIICAAIDVKGTFNFTTKGNWEGTVVLERNENNAGWETYKTYISKMTEGVGSGNVQLAATETADNVQYRASITNCDGTIDADITVDESTQDGIVRITGITNTKVAKMEVLTKLASATATRRWAEGAWSTVRGWPTSITFFEERCIYVGNVISPEQIYSIEGEEPPEEPPAEGYDIIGGRSTISFSFIYINDDHVKEFYGKDITISNSTFNNGNYHCRFAVHSGNRTEITLTTKLRYPKFDGKVKVKE